MSKKPITPQPPDNCRLLITGIPGTGKTFIGTYLAKVYGFQHINLETMDQLHVFYANKNEFLAAINTPVVITWGFVPDQQVGDVLFLKQNGFQLIWLDGNRPAALREFINRNTVSQEAFYAQLYKIETCKTVTTIVPDLILDTFDVQGQFKQINLIAQELLRLC